MSSKVPTSLYFIIIFLIVVEIIVLMPDRVDFSTTMQVEEKDFHTEADLYIDDFQLVETKSPHRYWTLNAEGAFLFREFDLGVLNSLRGKLVDEDIQKVSVTGKHGLIFVGDQALLLRDEVEAVTAEGYRLTADYFWYDNKKQLLKTASPVLLVGPDPEKPALRVSGQGLTASMDTQQHEILQNVRGHREYENEPPLDISAGYGRVDTAKQVADFREGVVVQKGDLKITSDQFRVRYLQKSREIDWASAKGNVRLWEGDWHGTAREAILRGQNRFVELRG
ncbi:MAG TPA: LPS export ABC transporter periplasmic protein LptC, partial [Bdellovibrionota bacterium]|nr:LPS export ABC transporter periplasmic protein LptC [Bdellovibrionota bacterium]